MSIQLIYSFFIIFFSLLKQEKACAEGSLGNIQIDKNLSAFSSTRSISMANIFTAIADDESSAYMNPAGMTYLNNAYASFSFTRVSYDKLAGQISFVGYSQKKIFFYHLTNRFLAYPTIDQSSLQGNLALKYEDFLNIFYFGAGVKINDLISLGTNLKITYRNFPESRIGSLLDLSLITKVVPFFKIALFLENLLGFELNLTTQELAFLEPLDPNFKMGVATSFSPDWSVSFEIIKNLKDKDLLPKWIYGASAYIKIFEWGSPLKTEEASLLNEDLKNIREEKNSDKNQKDEKTDKNLFKSQNIFINLGLNSLQELAFGMTMNLEKLKIDMAILFKELSWKEMTLSFNLAVPFKM